MCEIMGSGCVRVRTLCCFACLVACRKGRMTPPRLAPITTAPTQAGLASAFVGTEKFAAKIEIKTAKVLVIIAPPSQSVCQCWTILIGSREGVPNWLYEAAKWRHFRPPGFPYPQGKVVPSIVAA
jgi:hypothetical protein